jgi:hypothetical protein
MLVDFADLDATQTQISPGNSGVSSSRISAMALMWVNGEYEVKPHSRDKPVGVAASLTMPTP